MSIHSWDRIRPFLCMIAKTDGCLLWAGQISASGYGMFNVPNPARHGLRTKTPAHRFAWEVANGQRVPDGYTVDHRCHVTLCVNPDHLAIEPPRGNLPRTREQRRRLIVPPQFAHAVPENCGLVVRQPTLFKEYP